MEHYEPPPHLGLVNDAAARLLGLAAQPKAFGAAQAIFTLRVAPAVTSTGRARCWGLSWATVSAAALILIGMGGVRCSSAKQQGSSGQARPNAMEDSKIGVSDDAYFVRRLTGHTGGVAACDQRPRRGLMSAVRNTRSSAQQPRKRFETCQECHGAITYYPRRDDDPVPRTCSVDDSARWAHDVVSDWIGNPHRARPVVQNTSGDSESPTARARPGNRAPARRGGPSITRQDRIRP